MNCHKTFCNFQKADAVQRDKRSLQYRELIAVFREISRTDGQHPEARLSPGHVE